MGGGTSTLTLRNDFPSDVSADTIRAWASTSADQIEEVLAIQAGPVDRYNESLRSRIQALVDSRLEAGTTVERLSKELKDGI